MTGLYVLTSPRPEGDPWRYVRAVLAAARDEKIDNPRHLVVDGTIAHVAELEQLAPEWRVHRYERPEGNWLGGNKWPWWRLLEIAREHSPGDEVLTLEDDLEFAPAALRRMLLLGVPRDCAAVSFFSGFLFRQPRMHPGLWRTPAAIQGCQALKFSAATVDLLCRWKVHDGEWQKFNESDTALGIAQNRLRLRFAHHLPDVIQHIGDVSAVSHEMAAAAGIEDASAANHTLGGRQSLNYVGPHFDCMLLFSRHDLYL